MSRLSVSGSFDFWEAVHCSQCFLLFASEPDGPPPVPFWLTECGHVICNNHLNADQSCVQCGEQGIQLIPLQRDMDPPMSQWFNPVSDALSGLAYAVKFQQETLAALLRYYKTRCTQQKSLIERMMADIAESKSTKKMNEQLRQENEELRQYLGYDAPQSDPSELLNVNGKRQMAYPPSHDPRSNSSPRSIVTPVGPNRLTLPPVHLQPTFNGGGGNGSDLSGAQMSSNHRQGQRIQPVQPFPQQPTMDRPGSSRFRQEYAYIPAPDQPQSMQIPVLSHAQAAPTRHAQARAPTSQRDAHGRTMPPPSIQPGQQLKRPKPAVQLTPSRDRIRMPPPPTPQGRMQQPHQQRNSFRPSGQMQPPPGGQSSSSAAQHRFIPPTLTNPNRYVPPTPNADRTRAQSFVPATPSAGPQRFLVPTDNQRQGLTRAPSRVNGGGQRAPFVSGGAQNRFG